MERDYFMSPQEAKDYGLVDEILIKKKPEAQQAK
jgi:ATP-dependent protease ClpP protease subunit